MISGLQGFTLKDRGFVLLVVLAAMTSFMAMALDELWLSVLPVAALGVIYLLSGSINTIYLLTALLIPFSTELDLAGGLGLVFPGELMFLLLTALGIVKMITSPPPMELFNSLTLILFLHLFWIGYTAIFAEIPLISFKYLLAKIWFVIPFYVLPFYIFREQIQFDQFLKVIVWSTMIAACYVFIKHGLDGLTFDSRTNAGKPFFRNHVNYACLLLMVIPTSYYLYQRNYGLRYVLLIPLLLIFLYFTYARIAYVALAMMIAMWIVYRLRFMRIAVVIGLVGLTAISLSFLSGDTLLHYAPDYETTVSHKRFDRLIEASYQFKDISTMERAYRWMAGLEMITERPFLGFGPANFYENYQSYAINSFQTYVSDNPERSGIHNYYLMLIVEQGIFGLLIFLGLSVTALWKIAQYRATAQTKPLIQLTIFWLVGICIVLLLNDMIEVIKFGPFFFLALWSVSRLQASDSAPSTPPNESLDKY